MPSDWDEMLFTKIVAFHSQLWDLVLLTFWRCLYCQIYRPKSRPNIQYQLFFWWHGVGIGASVRRMVGCVGRRISNLRYLEFAIWNINLQSLLYQRPCLWLYTPEFKKMDGRVTLVHNTPASYEQIQGRSQPYPSAVASFPRRVPFFPNFPNLFPIVADFPCFFLRIFPIFLPIICPEGSLPHHAPSGYAPDQIYCHFLCLEDTDVLSVLYSCRFHQLSEVGLL